MRVKEILNNYELCLADIEVMLNGETRSAPTLCVTDGHEVIPLNTPDGRPIQMNKDMLSSLVMERGSNHSNNGG